MTLTWRRKCIVTMSYHLVRLELHNGSRDAYENLHVYMTAAGFSKTVVDSTGVTRSLPDATYLVEGRLSDAQVCVLVRAAASRTGLKFGFVCVAVTSVFVEGLEPVHTGWGLNFEALLAQMPSSGLLGGGGRPRS